MMTPDKFALALRMTESDNNPRAYGDGGLALTSYQVHPAWVWDQLQFKPPAPRVGDSWENWIYLLVVRFYERWSPYLRDVEVAMYYHRGHYVKPGAADWDQDYADRFSMFANRL